MKSIFLVFLMSCLALSVSEHLILGNYDNTQMIHHTIEQYNAVPFTKRIKEYFFSSSNQTTINSIIAYDNLNSKASALVTAGGIGFTYLNIKMKSERGNGLDYDIGIYA